MESGPALELRSSGHSKTPALQGASAASSDFEAELEAAFS
jgi:hypothetical protein